MDKIKRYFETYIPDTRCNFRCEYCLVTNEITSKKQEAPFQWTPEQMGKAVTKERLGGTCYFHIAGQGETLIPDAVKDITYAFLKQGHYVNLTTNGTYTKKIRELTELCGPHLSRLHFLFSLHYLELVRTNTLGDFFDNIRFVKSLGCSYTIGLCLYDGYIPCLDEIKKACLKELGHLPFLVVTRLLNGDTRGPWTKLTTQEYLDMAKSFGNSALLEFQMEHYTGKQKNFCYAGDWMFTMDLTTGILKSCYTGNEICNMFAEPDKPIPYEATGNCPSKFCTNPNSFMTWGCVPSIKSPTFLEMRGAGGFYAEEAQYFFNSKLAESNKEYNPIKKFWINCKNSNRGEKIMRRIITPPPPRIGRQYRFIPRRPSVWLHKAGQNG